MIFVPTNGVPVSVTFLKTVRTRLSLIPSVLRNIVEQTLTVTSFLIHRSVQPCELYSFLVGNSYYFLIAF